MSVRDPDDHRLDHVVVLMFENHSFDSLLGYLYGPNEVPAFEGVQDRRWSNPVPSTVGPSPGPDIPVHPSTSMATPYPDPGEEYPHVNTQLFGVVDPPENERATIDEMRPPFNAPSGPVARSPGMNGFVLDYVNTFRTTMGRPPAPAEYAQIMASYRPEQLPVLSALARGFPCFDHWFCEVPSQTFPNRSFFHAATSSGFVLNGHPSGKYAVHNTAPTLFNRLSDAGRSWRVYIDPRQIVPATALLHARQLDRYFPTHFATLFDFDHDARSGTLPDYSFLEPNLFHPHTDMHPHSADEARLTDRLHLPAPDTLLGGEQLLAAVYGAVRDGGTPDGSNWRNTALLVTFDEHGGTFDHVPPPAAVAPDASEPEDGFGFDRLGVRVPTVLVSAWTEPRTVVSGAYRHTSLLRTLRDWWDLGPPLTARDVDAPSLLPVLSKGAPRAPDGWPVVAPRAASLGERIAEAPDRLLEPLDLPLERLERDVLGEALGHEARVDGSDRSAEVETIPHRDAHDHLLRIRHRFFPGLESGRTS